MSRVGLVETREGGARVPDNAVTRVSAVLDCFGVDAERLGVCEIARRSGLPKSTSSRLIADMVRHGLLERHEDGAIGLGSRLFELGQYASWKRTLRDVTLPLMADLRAATRQTVHLAVMDATEVVYVEIIRGEEGPAMPSRVGGRLPAYASAVGKAMLAYSPRRVVEEAVAAGMTPIGPRTLTSPRLLAQQLAAVRETGVAFEREESGRGIACVACPILDADGRPIAALSVSGWSGQLRLDRMAPAVRTAALTAGRLLAR